MCRKRCRQNPKESETSYQTWTSSASPLNRQRDKEKNVPEKLWVKIKKTQTGWTIKPRVRKSNFVVHSNLIWDKIIIGIWKLTVLSYSFIWIPSFLRFVIIKLLALKLWNCMNLPGNDDNSLKKFYLTLINFLWVFKARTSEVLTEKITRGNRELSLFENTKNQNMPWKNHQNWKFEEYKQGIDDGEPELSFGGLSLVSNQ
jgi:hypothetical protein